MCISPVWNGSYRYILIVHVYSKPPPLMKNEDRLNILQWKLCNDRDLVSKGLLSIGILSITVNTRYQIIIMQVAELNDVNYTLASDS